MSNWLTSFTDEERGIDWDLSACLENNPQEGFTVADIEKVLAVVEGENDEADWNWILVLKNERIIFLYGGCDYTGWDCRSWANHVVCETIADALNACLEEYNEEYYNILLEQINAGKNKTWHEAKKEEFGNPPMIDPHSANDVMNEDE